MDKLAILKEMALKAAQEAQDIAQKSLDEGRAMTDEETDVYRAAMEKAADLLEQAKTAKKDADLLTEVKNFTEQIGLSTEDVEVTGQVSRSPRATTDLGLTVVKSPAYQNLLKGFGGRIPDRAQVQTTPIQVKSLFTGAARTSAGAFVTAEDSGIIELFGRRPLTLRDLVSVRATSSDVVEFVRQTSHTNKAAVVPEAKTSSTTAPVDTVQGGYKPEGEWAFERVSVPVVTIAEWVPATNRALADAKQLEGLINDELATDVAEAEETAMLKGDGSSNSLTGILSTSGIQSQTFETDLFTTVRKALTKARVSGRAVPNGILMAPADIETVDLARENGATGKFLGAGPFSVGPRTLWGVPIVESEAIDAGTALVGDFTKAVLWDREQTTVTLSNSHADFFVRNLVAVLAEERVAFGVTRPTAFVKTSLA